MHDTVFYPHVNAKLVEAVEHGTQLAFNQTEIAALLNVSHQRINKIEATALAKMLKVQTPETEDILRQMLQQQ